MASSRRAFRIAEQVREVISRSLLETADPRFNLITVTSVVVNTDLKNAKVYWVNSENKFKVDDVTKALNKASGFFRKQVSGKLKLRSVPEIRFYFDDTTRTMLEVTELLNRIRSDEEEWARKFLSKL